MAKKAVIIGGGIAGIYVMKDLLDKRGAIKEELKITLIKREDTGWVSVCGLPMPCAMVRDRQSDHQ